MLKSHKFRTVAMAVGALAAMFSASSANAYTYGVSHLEFKDLTIAVTGATTTNTSYNFTLNGDAAFASNSSVQANTKACNGTTLIANCNYGVLPAGGHTLNLAPISAFGSVPINRVDNDFTFIGTGGNTYANADSVIWNSELLNGGGTRTQQISEALLNTNDFASSNSKVGSTSGLVFTFVVAGGATLKLDFMADADMQVENTSPSFNNGTVNMNASFTLRKTGAGGGSVTWAPAGTAVNDCAVTTLAGVVCMEDIGGDGENLNQQIATDVTPDTQSNTSFNALAEYSKFGLTVTGLKAGTYQVILNAGTGVGLERFATPEPGSLALIGVALAGLGLATSRRKSKQA